MTEAQRAWRKTPEGRAKMRAIQKRYSQSEQGRAQTRKWATSSHGKLILQASAKRSRFRARIEVLEHYSGSPPRCQCSGCDVTELKFLAMDHIDGGGAAHRRETKHASIYLWLKRNNFPVGFQVLCHNCNNAKGFYGRCPHLDRRNDEPSA